MNSFNLRKMPCTNGGTEAQRGSVTCLRSHSGPLSLTEGGVDAPPDTACLSSWSNPGICTMTREEKIKRELYLILESGQGLEARAASLGDGVRIHALPTAAEHDVRCLLGLLLLLEQSHGAQRRVARAHLLQERLLVQLLHPPLCLHLA